MLLFDVISVRLEHLLFKESESCRSLGHREAASVSNPEAEIQKKGLQTAFHIYLNFVFSKETRP